MRSLQIKNGDLVLGTRGYAEVTGKDKIVQDLNIAVLTPYGSNRFHPTWGCTLDSKIGTPQSALTSQLISTEIKRVVGVLMAQQKAQLQTSQSYGYSSPYNNADLISGISSITVTPSYDSVLVNCVVSSASSQTVTLVASVSPAGVIGTVQ